MVLCVVSCIYLCSIYCTHNSQQHCAVFARYGMQQTGVIYLSIVGGFIERCRCVGSPTSPHYIILCTTEYTQMH